EPGPRLSAHPEVPFLEAGAQDRDRRHGNRGHAAQRGKLPGRTVIGPRARADGRPAMNFEHLTDEQFANLLAADRSDTRVRLHVESCAACQRELTSLGAAVGDLNYASLRWAEQRAARIEVPSRWVLNWNAMPGWGATLAGVLLFG